MIVQFCAPVSHPAQGVLKGEIAFDHTDQPAIAAGKDGRLVEEGLDLNRFEVHAVQIQSNQLALLRRTIPERN